MSTALPIACSPAVPQADLRRGGAEYPALMATGNGNEPPWHGPPACFQMTRGLVAHQSGALDIVDRRDGDEALGLAPALASFGVALDGELPDTKGSRMP